MNAASLPARVVYAAVALPLGGAVGFYSCMRFLPEFAARHTQLDPEMDGSGIFKLALCAGVAFAFTASLFALTLPWIRHRKRRGRAGRMGFSCVMVILLSVMFADQGLGLLYDLAFVAWLTYMMAFTFVRYGVIDQAKRLSSTASEVC